MLSCILLYTNTIHPMLLVPFKQKAGCICTRPSMIPFIPERPYLGNFPFISSYFAWSLVLAYSFISCWIVCTSSGRWACACSK